MYWYNQQVKQFLRAGMMLLCTGMLCASCRPEIKEAKGSLAYFDIKGFFTADAARLNREQIMVTKTVMHNGDSQTKNINNINWVNEFALFINSDINKPAWSSSYTIQNTNGLLVYKAKTPDLKTSLVVIKKDGDKIRSIIIDNHTANMLYENTEQLTYFPDSVYQISKWQKVRFLGKNTYSIKGVFVKRD